MPELPEVETVKNGIQKFIGYADILNVSVRNPHLRTDVNNDFVQNVVNAKIIGYERKAKYILIHLNNHHSIILHLGMSGKIKTCIESPENLDKHDHILIKTSAGYMIYNDPRRFGMFRSIATSEISTFPNFLNLGIDPFDDRLTTDYLYGHLQKRTKEIKPVLLDQKLIAGIGNIYASEILYAAQISPTRPANKISKQECCKIIEKIRLVLKLAIDNGGSTLHDYQRPDGSLGYFQNLHCVYNKAGQRCPMCICQKNPDGGIRKIVQDGRSTFFCPVKQK